MKAADTGREPVTLSAMEQFVDDEIRIYQDPYASSMLTSSMRFFIGFCRFSWFRNIPLRCFTYASAAKCAEQLVLEDSKN